MEFTEAEKKAIQTGDSDYILDVGARLYQNEEYKEAVEYYRLAASMGNMYAISNLGYCYMYGRYIEKDINIAIEYFEIAADYGIIDAIYKLGNIYLNGIEGKEDRELGIYYYEKVERKLKFFSDEERLFYPSEFFSLAKEYMPGGYKKEDLRLAFEYLRIAKKGYKYLIGEGDKFYAPCLKEVEKLMKDKVFDVVKRSN